MYSVIGVLIVAVVIRRAKSKNIYYGANAVFLLVCCQCRLQSELTMQTLEKKNVLIFISILALLLSEIHLSAANIYILTMNQFSCIAV